MFLKVATVSQLINDIGKLFHMSIIKDDILVLGTLCRLKQVNPRSLGFENRLCLAGMPWHMLGSSRLAAL